MDSNIIKHISAGECDASGYKEVKAVIDMPATGARIKALCIKQGYSIDDLMKITGILSRQAVYRWFKGDTLPALENMLILRNILGLSSIEELLVYELKW